jgi:hypothetical protein
MGSACATLDCLCSPTLGVSGAALSEATLPTVNRGRSTPLLGASNDARRLKAMAYGEARPGRRTSTFSPTVITMRSSPTSSGPE